MKQTHNSYFIRYIKNHDFPFSYGLWDLPRGTREVSCDFMIDDTLQMISLLKEAWPKEFTMAMEYMKLSYVVANEKRLRKWICQLVGWFLREILLR